MALATATPAAAAARCGELMEITADHGGFQAALAFPESTTPVAVLILLPGGNGVVNLDDRGCPRSLVGNSLIRSMPAFHAAGFATALVDAPPELHGSDGLGGFRTDRRHAHGIALLLRELHARVAAPVWVVGTSRGAISAANVASTAAPEAAPDGVVLTSPVTVGNRGKFAWTAQTVFDLLIEQIKMPLLVVGHDADKCFRSPPSNLARIAAAATASSHKQVAVMTGGPGSRFAGADLGACEGRQPHGFVDQETEMVAGIARFIRGGAF